MALTPSARGRLVNPGSSPTFSSRPDQVKAYKQGHEVAAKEVRELLGVMDRDRNVSKRIITTTSTFAPGAEHEMKEYIPHRLELKAGKATHEWLTGLMRK